MILAQLYSRFQIPPNLARHMAEVATVCRYVMDHWTGPEKIDQKLVIDAALVHDLANIIKFKRPFKGDLETEGEYWQKVQSQVIAQYGQDVHQASIQMLAEAGLARLQPVLQDMFHIYTRDYDSDETPPASESRIVEYADDCVVPEGIVGFETRMQDLYRRYNFSAQDDKARRLIANKDWIQARVGVELGQMPVVQLQKAVRDFSQHKIDS